MPYKVKNWQALSHEQYFSKHRLLGICRCALKFSRNLDTIGRFQMRSPDYKKLETSANKYGLCIFTCLFFLIFSFGGVSVIMNLTIYEIGKTVDESDNHFLVSRLFQILILILREQVFFCSILDIVNRL